MPVKRALRRMGFDVIAYKPNRYPQLRRAILRETYGTSLVLDVGANEGQYSTELRRMGYRGRIVSFEPVSTAFRGLQKRMASDPRWEGRNCALGDVAGESLIHIGGNTQSSSLRSMLPVYTEASPHSQFVGSEKIQVKTLDELLPFIVTEDDRVWLKVDAQGFEKNILIGARNSISKIDTVQLELSLTPLYEGQALIAELYQYMFDLGYRMVAIDPAFENHQSGELLAVDGIFHRFLA